MLSNAIVRRLVQGLDCDLDAPLTLLFVQSITCRFRLTVLALSRSHGSSR